MGVYGVRSVDVGSMRTTMATTEREASNEMQRSDTRIQGSNDILRDARIYSHFNNYLNDRWTSQRSVSQQRWLKLEQLVDKFWLKDGEIDESLFEDSSDEEGI
ncbi:hypothetical protein HG537_0H03850 [Torulaspora globosa]|uniref:Uncharacterized protein n=1 Tax=Torulaspora globosa TaxID=48254 RepID=A0A7H9I1E4_9SACH|nr:hypothetical protein HG537_0H03850 [Torulaspora sp. CBS 2947]